MSGGNCTRPDGQAPGNSGHSAANSGAMGFRLAQRPIRAARRSRPGTTCLTLSFDGKPGAGSWKTGLEKLEL